MHVTLKNFKPISIPITLTYFLLILITYKFANSHSGNTNSSGFHNDNINGGYHCHNEKYKETEETKDKDD